MLMIRFLCLNFICGTQVQPLVVKGNRTWALAPHHLHHLLMHSSFPKYTCKLCKETNQPKSPKTHVKVVCLVWKLNLKKCTLILSPMNYFSGNSAPIPVNITTCISHSNWAFLSSLLWSFLLYSATVDSTKMCSVS